ncbi:MAG: rhomboid family intramembrane serine protease [Bacteroidota bacterium]
MGEADRYMDYKQPRRRFTLGDDNNALVALVTINIAVYILLLVIEVIYGNMQGSKTAFAAEVLPWFQLPANLSSLVTRPWTLLTAMFTHISIWNMLGNMLWLWTFGFILQGLSGNKRLIPVYIYGGLAGAVVFIIAVNLLPGSRQYSNVFWLYGANASNIALAAAATMLAPDYRFFRNIGGGIPIWVLTTIFIIIDFAAAVRTGTPFCLAHLAGAGAGFIFVYFVRKGKDGSVWMNNFYYWCMNVFNPKKKHANRAVKEKVFYNTGERKPYRKSSNVTQQRIDEILDKINQKGYHFLTDEEKNILKRAAEEDL